MTDHGKAQADGLMHKVREAIDHASFSSDPDAQAREAIRVVVEACAEVADRSLYADRKSLETCKESRAEGFEVSMATAEWIGVQIRALLPAPHGGPEVGDGEKR